MAYFRVFLLRLACCVVAVAAMILVVDPYGKRSLGWFPVVLQDDHLPKWTLLREFARQGPVEALLFGTSRSLMLDPNLMSQITGLRWFNFGVSDASFGLMRTFYREARGLGIRPRKVFVGVEIDRLLGRERVERRADGAARGEIVPTVLQRIQEFKGLFMLDVLTDTGRSIAAKAGILHPRPHNYFTANGGFLGRGDVSANEPRVDHMVKACAEDYHRQFQLIDSIRESNWTELKGLVGDALADRAAVTIYITPLNPTVAGAMTRDTRYPELTKQVLDRLRAFAAASGIALCDWTEASPEIEDHDWADCTHFGKTIADRLLQRLFRECAR